MGGKFRREGTHVCLWLIHIDVWQKPTQYCKAIILQLKKKKKKTEGMEVRLHMLVWISQAWSTLMRNFPGHRIFVFLFNNSSSEEAIPAVLCCALSCLVVSDSLRPHGLCSPPGSSVHGILQARILEWVAMPSSRGSSQPRYQT